MSRDPDAWVRLSALFGPEVYAWCRRAGLQPSDAADVGQEVFRAVFVKLAHFRRDRPGDSFRGWLWTITRNKIRDHWRRSARRDEAIGGSDVRASPARTPLETVDTHDTDGELVRRALELVRLGFEDQTWQAFWRVAVEQRPATEVAVELGLSPNAVYIAKSRVLSRLRWELGETLS